MKYVETFEGFNPLSWFKKDNKEVKISDIHECLYDLLDLVRVNIGRTYDYIFNEVDDVGRGKFTRKNFLYSLIDSGSGYVFANIYSDKYILIKVRYDSNIIKDDFKETLLECESRLKGILDCKLSFYLSWGRDEGRSENTEIKSVDKLFDKMKEKDKGNFNITIKISSPTEIINDDPDITTY